MKTCIYLFLLLLATASCSKQIAPDNSVGYLRVENITLTCDTETLSIIRAVDARFKLSLSAGHYKRLNVTYNGASTPIIRALVAGDFYYSNGDICPSPLQYGVHVMKILPKIG